MRKLSGTAVCIGWALALALCLLAGCPQGSGPETELPGESAVVIPATNDVQPETVADNASDGREVTEVRPDYPEVFTTSFMSARHPGETGKLSDLNITVDMTQNEKQLGSEDLTVSASEPEPFAQFDLPEYRIQITPLIQPPIKLDAKQYGSYGGYRVTLLSPELKKMSVFEVNKKAELSRADSLTGYSLRVLLAAPEETLYTYAIFPEGEDSEPLLAIDLEIDGFEPATTADASGATYEYRFPVLTVTVHNKRLAEELKVSRAANQQAISHDPLGGMWVLR